LGLLLASSRSAGSRHLDRRSVLGKPKNLGSHGLGLSLSDSLRSLACGSKPLQAFLLRSPSPPTRPSRAPSMAGFPGPTGSALRLSQPLSGLRRPATLRPCLVPLTSMGFFSRPLEFFSLAGPSSSRSRFLPCRYNSPDDKVISVWSVWSVLSRPWFTLLRTRSPVDSPLRHSSRRAPGSCSRNSRKPFEERPS
jgi:hypothetical protein